MKQKYFWNAKANMFFAVMITLFTFCILFHISLYAGHGNINAYDTTEPAIKIGNERMVKKGDINITVQTAAYDNAQGFYKSVRTAFLSFGSDIEKRSDLSDCNSKISSILSFAADLCSICCHAILVTVFFVLCLEFFITLPDDFTLINHMVRLDD